MAAAAENADVRAGARRLRPRDSRRPVLPPPWPLGRWRQRGSDPPFDRPRSTL